MYQFVSDFFCILKQELNELMTLCTVSICTSENRKKKRSIHCNWKFNRDTTKDYFKSVQQTLKQLSIRNKENTNHQETVLAQNVCFCPAVGFQQAFPPLATVWQAFLPETHTLLSPDILLLPMTLQLPLTPLHTNALYYSPLNVPETQKPQCCDVSLKLAGWYWRVVCFWSDTAKDNPNATGFEQTMSNSFKALVDRCLFTW